MVKKQSDFIVLISAITLFLVVVLLITTYVGIITISNASINQYAYILLMAYFGIIIGYLVGKYLRPRR